MICFTGGTSVSEAVACPAWETRMIVSLDTSQMVNITLHFSAPVQTTRRICKGVHIFFVQVRL